MKTLFVSYRVTDLDRSLDFYFALGYAELGRINADHGVHLAILHFPGEPAASLELVHRPADGRVDVGSGFDHLAIQVDSLAATMERLADAGLRPGPVQYPGGLDLVARRPGRLPDRVGGVAVRPCRRHHGG